MQGALAIKRGTRLSVRSQFLVLSCSLRYMFTSDEVGL